MRGRPDRVAIAARVTTAVRVRDPVRAAETERLVEVAPVRDVRAAVPVMAGKAVHATGGADPVRRGQVVIHVVPRGKRRVTNADGSVRLGQGTGVPSVRETESVKTPIAIPACQRELISRTSRGA